MSLTVADCLKIGILQQGKVVAGKTGLENPVENVSFLEFNGYEIEDMGTSALRGNEMALTSFHAFQDCPEKLIEFMEKFSVCGSSCIVIFYLKQVLKKIPDQVLSLCNAYGIPMIVLPSENLYYAYSDVIMPVSEAISQDRHVNQMFVSDTLEEFTNLNPENQNIHTLLRLLQKRTECDLLLMDTEFKLLDWVMQDTPYLPASLCERIYPVMKNRILMTPASLTLEDPSVPVDLKLLPIRTPALIGTLIAVKRSEKQFNLDLLTQAAEVLRLFLQIWRGSRSKLNELEALLQGGESSSWCRKVRFITVIRGHNGKSLNELHNEFAIAKLMEDPAFFQVSLSRNIAYFNGSIIIADITEMAEFDLPAALETIRKRLKSGNSLCAAKLPVAFGENLQKVYESTQTALPAACMLFDNTCIFTPSQISFAKAILEVKNRLGSNTDSVCSILSPLYTDINWDKICDTLDTLYFKCGGNLTDTAKHLGIHLNTMKYRMKKISELLGIDLTSSLGSSQVVMALAVLKISGK